MSRDLNPGSLALNYSSQQNSIATIACLSRVSSLSKATRAYFWSLARSLKSSDPVALILNLSPETLKDFLGDHLSPAPRLSSLVSPHCQTPKVKSILPTVK